MKRIAIFCDGTWNRLDAIHPTNVVAMYQAIAPWDDAGRPQVAWYDEGVGSGAGSIPLCRKLDRFLGGAFGYGLTINVEEAYRFLVATYEPGDAIYIFGFSRGAFTARSLAGLIRNCGIVSKGCEDRIPEAIRLYRSREPEDRPDSARSVRFRSECSPDIYVSDIEANWRRQNTEGFDKARVTRLEIAYVGVWDTVGALGVPSHIVFSSWFNHRHRFHDTDLSRSVASARHAIAIDERRRTFPPSPWRNLDYLNLKKAHEAGVPPAPCDEPYQQLWFPGVHGSVGGGGDIKGLSSATFDWIAQGAMKAGLAFKPGALDTHFDQSDHRASLKNRKEYSDGVFRFLGYRDRLGPDFHGELAPSALCRWHERADALAEGTLYRPGALKRVAWLLEALPPDLCVKPPRKRRAPQLENTPAD